MKEHLENTDKALGWAEKLLELARKYRWFEWAEAILIASIVCILVTIFTHPTAILNFFSEAAQEKHTELMEQRRQNNAEVQKIADRLLYTFNADRALLLELHNGANSTSGIPFLRTSVTFEVLNDNTLPIASQYQGVSISLIPFLNYLYTQKYWAGNTENIGTIDKSLMHKMLGNSTNYFVACLVEGVNSPLGFLVLSFEDKPNPENIKDEDIEFEMKRAAIQMAVYLEVRNK